MEYLVVRTGRGITPHKHNLRVPYSAIKNPPEEGIVLNTEKAFFHSHPVELSKVQLQAIAAGETVVGIWKGHKIEIALPKK